MTDGYELVMRCPLCRRVVRKLTPVDKWKCSACGWRED